MIGFVLDFVTSARPSKLRAKIIIAGIWLISGMLAAPMAVALRVEMVPESVGGESSIVSLLCVFSIAKQ